MKNIFLIRHGHNERTGEILDHQIELDHIGIDQAKKMAAFLRGYFSSNDIDTVSLYSSEFKRALMTAAFIEKEFGTLVNLNSSIYEMQFGDNEAKPKEEWIFTAPFNDNKIMTKTGLCEEKKFMLRHLNGESPKDVYDRVVDFTEGILSDCQKNILIVGHGVSLRMINMHILQEKENWYYNEPIPRNCSVKQLKLINKKCISSEYIYEGN